MWGQMWPLGGGGIREGVLGIEFLQFWKTNIIFDYFWNFAFQNFSVRPTTFFLKKATWPGSKNGKKEERKKKTENNWCNDRLDTSTEIGHTSGRLRVRGAGGQHVAQLELVGGWRPAGVQLLELLHHAGQVRRQVVHRLQVHPREGEQDAVLDAICPTGAYTVAKDHAPHPVGNDFVHVLS